jgi:hypothetical protein
MRSLARGSLQLLVAALLGIVGAVALPAEASAQSRVVVLPFEGSNAARLREDVVKTLARQDDVELVASSDAQDAADGRGADLTTNDGRATVAGELSVSAFVGGNVDRSGARRELTVVVYDGSDGSSIGEATFSGRLPAVRRKVRGKLWSELGSAIGQGRAPVATEPEEPEEEEELFPEDESEEEPKQEPEPEDGPEDDDSGEASPDAIQFRLGFTAASRVFSYEDDLHGNLRDYCLAPWCDSFGIGPLVNFGMRWYPGTHFTDGFGANIGLDFRGSIMLGVSSQQQDGSGEFDTTHRRIGIGLRLRVPIDDHELGLVVGYGNYAFEVEAGSNFTGLPAVSYGFVRLEGSGRIMVADSLGLLVSAAYLVPIAYGEIAEDEWFPHTSGGGIEAEIGGAYELLGWLDAELAFSITRFFFSLNPEPSDLGAGDPFYRVAGGSSDRSFALRADLVAHF